MQNLEPPIHNLDAFDIVGERKDGGVDLVISCSGPLDSSDRNSVVIGRYAHLRVDGENTQRAQDPERTDDSPNHCPHTLGPHIRRAIVSHGRFLP